MSTTKATEPDNRTQKEFCQDLMRRAPEGGDEFWSFHRAAHYYELAEIDKNKTTAAQRARMKASRAYKKGWKLKNQRTADKKMGEAA